MAGKHRGPSRKNMAGKFTRYTLDPEIERRFLEICHEDQRSIANMVSVLITEFVLAQKDRKSS